MKRRAHHGNGDDYIILTNWKVSNFLANCLIKGWNVRYYPDTKRFHYWKDSKYRIVDINIITATKTGLEYD